MNDRTGNRIMKPLRTSVPLTAGGVAATAMSAAGVMAPTFAWAQAPAEPDRYLTDGT